MFEDFTMHGAINGLVHTSPVQRDLDKVSKELKNSIINDSNLSINQLAAKYNCTVAVIDFILQGY